MMSGIRNSPPISISSPRETRTCLPFASAARASSKRGGAVVDDEGVLGAGEGDQQSLGAGGALAARPGLAVDLEVASSRGRPGGGRERACSASGARPRFVCSTTPVALITGVSPVAMRDARPIASVTMSSSASAARGPRAARRRAPRRGSAVEHALQQRTAERRSAARRTGGVRRSESTEGTERRTSAMPRSLPADRRSTVRWVPELRKERLGCAEPSRMGGRIDEASRGGRSVPWRSLAVMLVPVAAPRAVTSTSPAPTSPWTFTVGVTGDLNSANPFRQIDTTESFVSRPDVRRLAPAGPEGLRHRAGARHRGAQLENGESTDGLTWTFHLRDGLTWSDGVPLTAHDFVWTAQLHHRPTTSARGATATGTPRASRPPTTRRSCGRRRVPRWCPGSPATA